MKNNSLIFGLGETGLSVARFLNRCGEQFVLADTRDIPPNAQLLDDLFPVTKKYFGTNHNIDFSEISQVIISPGLSRKEELIDKAVAREIPVIGDIELFAQFAEAPMIAVTGSNGKSSVVTLVTEMLLASGFSVACGGNIGTPALDLLLQPVPDYYVLELSSFQLESVVDFSPKIAAILNLSEDHMDRYDCFEDYVEAKLNIAKNAAHIVTHCAHKSRLFNVKPESVVTFAGQDSIEADYALRTRGDRQVIGTDTGNVIYLDSLNLAGAHNIENALAAIAITDLAGASSEAQTAALLEFSGLEHRTEVVGTWEGITWVNDSKGTNVGATVAAINGIFEDEKGILIAGGVGKGADFTPLQPIIRERVAATILLGQDADEIAVAIGDASPIHLAPDLESAIKIAKSIASTGATVLFSPACASFDMFSDYQQRGRAFKALVAELNQS